MGGGGELEEPNKYNLDIPRPMALEDLGAGAASPGAALPGMPAPTPRTTKSFNKILALSPSWGVGICHLNTSVTVWCTASTSIVDATTGE
jgi:hypothetical protein